MLYIDFLNNHDRRQAFRVPLTLKISRPSTHSVTPPERASEFSSLRDLVFYYVEAVQSDPYCAKTLVLATMIHPDPSVLRTRHTLWTSLSLVGGTHFRSYDVDRAQGYCPKNIYLLHSLLSGFSLKYNLTASSEMYGSIEDGLKATCGLKESEVLVVGTCIQLLLHGFRLTTNLAGNYQRKQGKITKKLKAHTRQRRW